MRCKQISVHYGLVNEYSQNEMSTKNLEILEGGQEAVSQKAVCAKSLFPFELELFGVRHNFCVVCRSETITLKDLVSPARQLCDIVVGQALEHQMLCGQPVRCSVGCMACCKYIITVSRAEALVINDMIDGLPNKDKRILLRNMSIASRKILGTGQSTIGLQNSELFDPLVALSRWYTKINLTCPFIADKRCSYYTERPLVCREFMVTSFPELCMCDADAKERRTIVDLPVKMSEVLMDVGAKLTGTKPQAMFLPLVPAWCDELSDLQNEFYDAGQAVQLLIEAIYANRQSMVKTESLGHF